MKQLQEAFDSLLPTEAQKEKMLCEILIARDGRPKRRMRGNPVRIAALTAAALALCVITASAAEALGVSQMIRDYFNQRQETDIMDSLNLAASGLKACTVEGWELTVTDLFGDENRCLMGVTLKAPAGTVLNRSDYRLTAATSGTPCTLPENMRARLEETQSLCGYLQKDYWAAEQIPDDNPNDNQISFVFDENLIYYQDGISVGFTFRSLSWEDGADRCEQHLDVTIPEIETHFTTNGYHLSPNLSVEALGGAATLSRFELTPLSVSYELSGEIIKKQFVDYYDAFQALPHEQFEEYKKQIPPTRPDRHIRFWGEENFACWRNTWFLDIPVVAYFKNGTSQEIGFTGESFGENTTTDADLANNTVFASYTFDGIFDLNQLDYITVCGQRITLPTM